jgi:sulfur carrier protein
MKIILNGADAEIVEGTLAQAMEALGYVKKLYATAVNGNFVRATERATYVLKAGDKVEIVSPRAGG